MVFALAFDVTSRDSQVKSLGLRKASMPSKLASLNKLLVESIAPVPSFWHVCSTTPLHPSHHLGHPSLSSSKSLNLVSCSRVHERDHGPIKASLNSAFTGAEPG